jgi:hypothetical protein
MSPIGTERTLATLHHHVREAGRHDPVDGEGWLCGWHGCPSAAASFRHEIGPLQPLSAGGSQEGSLECGDRACLGTASARQKIPIEDDYLKPWMRGANRLANAVSSNFSSSLAVESEKLGAGAVSVARLFRQSVPRPCRWLSQERRPRHPSAAQNANSDSASSIRVSISSMCESIALSAASRIRGLKSLS